MQLFCWDIISCSLVGPRQCTIQVYNMYISPHNYCDYLNISSQNWPWAVGDYNYCHVFTVWQNLGPGLLAIIRHSAIILPIYHFLWSCDSGNVLHMSVAQAMAAFVQSLAGRRLHKASYNNWIWWGGSLHGRALRRASNKQQRYKLERQAWKE